MAAEQAGRLLAESLATANVERRQIAGWIWHSGGRDVLQALRGQLGLSDADVRHSVAVLREYGNVSSPTVFFVLERDPAPDRVTLGDLSAARILVEANPRIPGLVQKLTSRAARKA